MLGSPQFQWSGCEVGEHHGGGVAVAAEKESQEATQHRSQTCEAVAQISNHRPRNSKDLRSCSAWEHVPQRLMFPLQVKYRPVKVKTGKLNASRNVVETGLVKAHAIASVCGWLLA